VGSHMSGRYGRRSYVKFTDDLLCLNLVEWRKRRWLQPYSSGYGQYVVRSASGTRTFKALVEWDLEDRDGTSYVRLASVFEVRVRLSTTEQPLGGLRWWIVCLTCHARCGKLYCDIGEWGCRSCLQLRYRCQHLNRAQRARARAEKYFERADTFRWVTSPRRPKRMHRTTHRRLLALAANHHAKWIELGVRPVEEETRRFLERFRRSLPKSLRPRNPT
jgi:hypothetical protein